MFLTFCCIRLGQASLTPDSRIWNMLRYTSHVPVSIPHGAVHFRGSQPQASSSDDNTKATALFVYQAHELIRTAIID